MVVTASTLIMREAPDQNSKKITGIPRGSVVHYLEAYNHGEFVQLDTSLAQYAPWLKVQFKDKTGYVYGAFLSGTYFLAYEDDVIDEVPPLQWYGVYARDSFSDEIRKIDLRVTEEFSELYGSKVKTLKTNQKQTSKFLIGTIVPLKTGYAGPLGMYHIGDMYTANVLNPGAMVSIYPGQDGIDTTGLETTGAPIPTYLLAATGCAKFDNDFVSVSDYRLFLIDYEFQPSHRQDLSPWVQTETPEVSPNVSLLWYGDLDMDNKPDLIIQDCPYEAGCRTSLFLSSKAKPGEYLHKVAEHFWPGE